jgi:uncharacterized C2H2 Zn-finger protein
MIYKCEICDEYFTSEQDYMKHVQLHRQEARDKWAEGGGIG